LMDLYNLSSGVYDDKALAGDIHQMLRHGVEYIAGTLCWLVYALHRHPKIRSRLEMSLQREDDVSSYAEAVIKETLRRYPVAGNMTVRTVGPNGYSFNEGVSVAEGTPVHVHMFSLQTTSREWEDAREFLPERWLQGDDEGTISSSLKCPFATTGGDIYSSGGFKEKSLAFFPFSSGERMCRGKSVSVEILRIVLQHVLPSFHLDPCEHLDLQEDMGISVHTVIVPGSAKSTTVMVSKVLVPGEVLKIAKKADGWAEESDEDE